MSERDDPGHKPGRQPAEGVRIIKAEEAQAALEAGEAAGRRPGDQLRYGDVPPAPSGPRPAHRFPLPDSVDPAQAVSLPPLAPQRPGEGRRAETPAPEAEHERQASGRRSWSSPPPNRSSLPPSRRPPWPPRPRHLRPPHHGSRRGLSRRRTSGR